MQEGRITRVRMEAEASELDSCRAALDSGFMTIHQAIIEAATASGLSYAAVFSRETEYGEEVFESQVRESGAIYWRGRRGVSFTEVGHPLELPAPLDVGFTGLILDDSTRLRRLELSAATGDVRADRAANGVWTVCVRVADAPAETPPWAGQGGTLSAALGEVERQVFDGRLEPVLGGLGVQMP